jgi:hypothetical protein
MSTPPGEVSTAGAALVVVGAGDDVDDDAVEVPALHFDSTINTDTIMIALIAAAATPDLFMAGRFPHCFSVLPGSDCNLELSRATGSGVHHLHVVAGSCQPLVAGHELCKNKAIAAADL